MLLSLSAQVCIAEIEAACTLLLLAMLKPASHLTMASWVSVLGFCDCRRTIYDDPFIRNYIEDLLKNIRTQVQHIAKLKV